MNEIACPKCGSTQLSANKKGFSGKKAVVGALLTGGVGIAAGTLGSNKIKITCLACGLTFNPGEGKVFNTSIEKQSSSDNAISSIDIEQAIINKIRSEGMLKAVILFKDLKGTSMVTSKKAVEDIANRFNVKPENAGKGCVAVILLFFISLFSVMMALGQSKRSHFYWPDCKYFIPTKNNAKSHNDNLKILTPHTFQYTNRF